MNLQKNNKNRIHDMPNEFLSPILYSLKQLYQENTAGLIETPLNTRIQIESETANLPAANVMTVKVPVAKPIPSKNLPQKQNKEKHHKSKKHEHLLIDRLMRRGVRFHPNTVVVDASEFTQDKVLGHLRTDDFYESPIGEICYPQFDYMFIEFMPSRQTDNGNHYGVYIMKESANHFSMIVFTSASDDVASYKQQCRGISKWKEVGFVIARDGLIHAEFNNNGQLMSVDNHNVIMNDDDLRCHIDGINIFWSYDELSRGNWMEGIFDESDAQIRFYCNPALYALAQLHKKAEVELIDYPAHALRRIERETSKEPSPFFMLKHQPINQKRYKYANPPKKEVSEKDKPKEVIPSQLPLTWIKGHFMTHPPTHPIPHFAGRTFFVEAHTRGDKKFGEVKKGYYIRQPKEKATPLVPVQKKQANFERAKQDFDNFIASTGSTMEGWGNA